MSFEARCRKVFRTFPSALLAVSLPIASQPSFAQTNDTARAVGGILGIFGAIAQSAARDKAQKEWSALSTPAQFCMSTALRQQRIDLANVINAGILPGDARLGPLIQRCDAIVGRTLKANVPCRVANSRGQPVQTICNEAYAMSDRGRTAIISFEDYITYSLNGSQVGILGVEQEQVRAARLKKEEDDEKAA